MAQVSENSWQSLAPIHSSIKAPLGHHLYRKRPGALWGLLPAMAPKDKARPRPGDSTPPRRVRSRQSETIERVTPEKAPEPGLASQAAASARAGQSAALAANAASGHAVEEVPIGSHWSEDEKFAARGLSIKSFAFQIPDSSGSKRKVDQMPGSSGTPGPPWKRTASGQNNNSHRQE